jgi:hypothetical protein
MSEDHTLEDRSTPAFDDDDEFADADDLDDEFDCGMDRDGNCGKAGSEECDWECPYGPPEN